MILNSKIEEKRGGAVTDICLFIFHLVQEKLKKSLPNFISTTILLHKFRSHASRKLENTIVNCIIRKLYTSG